MPMQELGRHMAMLDGKLPTHQKMDTIDRETIGQHILSIMMAYHVGYFGCNCHETWDFFESAPQVCNKITA
jgi:hypothetical protein